MLSRSATTCIIDDELNSYNPEQIKNPKVYEPYYVYGNNAANDLKKPRFLKSPIVIYNHYNVKGVIENAYLLRHQLEKEAIELKANKGIYIRPIILLVVSKETAANKKAIHALKKQFIDGGIAAEEIKIKTNTIDELTEIDLMDEECDVRYIIVVNELTERWKCPFAYVIASIEERAMVYDLTGVLNCMLPMPYTIKSGNKWLNSGYIISACSKFEKLIAPLSRHLSDSGREQQLITMNKMVELMKGVSIFRILEDESIYQGKIDFDILKADTHLIIEEIKEILINE